MEVIRLKKILLCGATQGSNFGDSLFAYMFMKNIKEKNNNIEVIFTKISEYSKNELGIKAATMKDLFSADAMIYISGGYFGETHNETLKGSLYRFLTYYTFGLLMILRKKPIAIIGVGAGPLKKKFLRKTVTYIFNKAQLISLRDEVSKDYMEKYGVTNKIITTSDSAQVIDAEIYSIKKNCSDIIINFQSRNLKKILIHVTGLVGKELYYDKVIKAIKETLVLDENNGFILTMDSINDNNSEFLNQVYNALPKDRTVIYDYKNPIDFLEVISSVDAIITPKLHVGILGCSYGKPVLSFPVHPEKTERYYKQIGYPNHCRSLYNLSKDQAKDMINKYIWEEIHIPIDIKKKAQKNFDYLDDFVKSIQ